MVHMKKVGKNILMILKNFIFILMKTHNNQFEHYLKE